MLDRGSHPENSATSLAKLEFSDRHFCPIDTRGGDTFAALESFTLRASDQSFPYHRKTVGAGGRAFRRILGQKTDLEGRIALASVDTLVAAY